MKQKLTTLTKVAKALNEAGITWALGGSGMLHFLGKLPDFRDVDLMVAQQDVAAAQQVFSRLEGLEYSGYEAKFDLLQYRVDGLELDVMKGFRFGEYFYRLQTSDIYKTVTVGSEQIPLHDPNVWREFYRLMGREERVALIDGFTK